MGGIDVASVVGSIISAFGSGLDVLHRVSGKKRKSKARLPHPAEEEEWLRRSLSNRPIEIRREYDQQVAKYGQKFQLGDGQAQSSLAHTLLVLNTGLINMINHALSSDAKSIPASHKKLYNLSETAAVETMTALAQLSSRLSMASPSRLALNDTDHRKSAVKQNQKARRSTSPAKSSPTKRPTPTPLLVRGGWVRSRSGSSVVSGNSAKKAREEQSGGHRGSKSEPALVKSSCQSPDRHKIRRQEMEDESRNSKTNALPVVNERKPSIPHSSSDHLRPQRQPSMLIVPADFFDYNATITEEPPVYSAPPRPPKIPLYDVPVLPQRRHRPVSTMTFMTASTKIGEIPEPKVLSHEELQQKPMPYTIPPPLEPIEPKRKRGFKFWKRDEKRHDIAAY